MTPDQPWMWHWGGMWIFPMIMIMFIAMVIFLFLFFGRAGCRPPWWGPRGYHREGGKPDSALEILNKRYAKGEITKEEYEQMKRDILA